MTGRKRFRGIIFDKDGTLFDFQSTWSPMMVKLLNALCEGDKECSRQKGRLLGFDLDKGLYLPESAFIAGTPEQFVEQLLANFQGWSEEELIRLLNEITRNTEQVEVVSLVPLLTELQKAGYVLGVATNDSEEDARRQLGEKGILEYFDFLVGFNSGYGSKPDPDMLLAFCQQTRIQPAETVMVGDSKSDLVAGKRAGMFTVAVLSGVAKSEDLAQHANLIIRDIGGLWNGLN
ncbi:MAG: HAD family hydrolase [Paracoccaceae bacterium]|nr:HAD family hydrolase [Paracoccaceae bacterium]MDE2674256.1 HAD family hydrolase [Paracoccaceae bacterium]